MLLCCWQRQPLCQILPSLGNTGGKLGSIKWTRLKWSGAQLWIHFISNTSRPFCYRGIISGGLGVSWLQTCERLSCVFWKIMTFTIWRIPVKHRATRLPSLLAFDKNSGLFIHALFTSTFPFLQFSLSSEDQHSEKVDCCVSNSSCCTFSLYSACTKTSLNHTFKLQIKTW